MRKLLIPSLAAILVIVPMLFQGTTINPVLTEAPDVVLGELSGFTSVAGAPGEAELTTLPKDTQFVKRIYTAEDGESYYVSAVIGGRSKSSVHRPELCLPSQGFQMMEPRTLTVGDIDWHCVTLARRDAAPWRFAYTFFNQEGFRTSSHMSRIFRDVWDRSILGRIDRWVMLTVYTSATDDAALSAFLDKLKGVVK